MEKRAAFFVFAAVLLLALTSSQIVHASATPVWAHPAGAQPASGPASAQGSQVSAIYDEQLGMTFSQDLGRLAYNVTALAQSDAQGFGPGYLLNGLTDGGYWYQVGLAYDWPYQSGGYDPGFNFLFEAFNSSGASVFPSAGGGGLLQFSGPVNSGDRVFLQLSFSGGQVVFSAHDWNTGSTASETFIATGSRFVGLNFSSGTHGFFTGLMTEWYHVSAYYGGEGKVVYSNPATPLISSVLWADEFNANDSTLLFGNQQSYTFSNPTELHIFSLDGATEYGDAFEFITGGVNTTPLTFSYSVSGGGNGYSAPLLSYYQNGVEQTAQLTERPTSYFADNGSFWQLSSTLPGGPGTERWVTAQQTNGTLTAPISDTFLYFHQYLVTFSFSVSGGGSGYTTPQVHSLELGKAATLTGDASAWVDAGSTYAYPPNLPGSTSSERWASQNYTGTVFQAATVDVIYYHQSSLTLGYSFVGGSSTVGPTLQGTQFGSPYEASVSNSTAYFLDQGTSWSVPQMLAGGTTQVRWVASQATSGNVTGPESVAFTYQHQYSFTSNVIPSSGGSVTVPNGWLDAGTTVQISEAPSQGWEFQGWTGSQGYSGLLNATTVDVSGPIQENATFYPGLTVEAGSNGAVSYSWSGGNGTVQGGRTAVVYLPPGMTVRLEATPSSALYSFAGWGSSESGSSSALSFSVSSPRAVSASFSLSSLVLAGGAATLVAVVATAALIAIRSRHGKAPGFNPPPSSPGPGNLTWK